jgi:OOP family OmpA-OmpF porin
MLDLERVRKERAEMTKRYMLVVLVLLTVGGGQAYSADRGFYVGAGIGVPNLDPGDFDENFENLKFDNESFGFKLFGGYRITKNFAVEGAYTDYGSIKHHEILPVGQENLLFEIDVPIDAWDLSVVGRLPVSNSVALYARVGGASYSADVRATIGDETDTTSWSGTDLTYGVGFDFLFSKVGLRISFDWLEIEDTGGVFMPAASMTYKF